jgi:hypothetical protein
MATRKSKNGDTERLDDASMDRVIELLANKGTKKDACAILNISYNTTRLGTLIEKYLEKKRKDAEKRAERRGKPATTAEIVFAIEGYLEGRTVESIADSLYRGATFVNSILRTNGVPLRSVPQDYFKPGLVPDEACRDSFKVGEKVYSMRYDSLAVIRSEFKPGIYCIYLMSDRQKQFAYQEACELASLDHLRKLGVNV